MNTPEAKDLAEWAGTDSSYMLDGVRYDSIPDYDNDMNAIRSLLKKLAPSEQEVFCLELALQVGIVEAEVDWSTEEDWKMLMAKPSQYLQALHKTLNL